MSAEKHIGIARKIAWHFHRTSGLDVDELMGIANLILVECSQKYDPEGDGKFSTYAYVAIKNRMINYMRKRSRIALFEIPEHASVVDDDWEFLKKDFEGYNGTERDLIFWQSVGNLDNLSKRICSMCIHDPSLNKASIGRMLRKEGVGWERIWRSFKAIEKMLVEIRMV